MFDSIDNGIYDVNMMDKYFNVITNDLHRRELEHQEKWPKGKIKQVGRKVSREAALQWERDGGTR